MRFCCVALIAVAFVVGCEIPRAPVSASGVKQATAVVNVGSDGLTAEQRNIKDRLAVDNKPGSVKHLYLLSPINGRQIFYSTVKGKVTSGGKRLTPTSVEWGMNESAISNSGVPVVIGGRWHTTREVIQDDGTYGSSAEYLYFWNESGQYFQLYVGGLAVVISDQPTSFQDVVIRSE